jgi:hypothetical protein
VAIQGLLDDERHRSDIGQAARARSELFTAARVLPQFEAMYEKLVTRSADQRDDEAGGSR